MKTLIITIAIIIACFTQAKAQTCNTCTQVIVGIDTSTINLGTGQTLCIDSTAIFKGNIVINGGTLCNNGVFSPKSCALNAGTINNSASFSVDGAYTLNANISLVNNSGAIISIGTNLTLGGASITNDGILNVSTALNASSGTFTNNSIINCSTITGETTIINNGLINKN
jgi:hypothetical protein